MKKQIYVIFFLVGVVVCSSGIPTQLLAQEQPQIQEDGRWMKAFVADGRLDEWDQPLQARNDDAHIEYSLANDDLYLYLAVRSNQTSKIFFGGVSLSVERPGRSEAMVLFPHNIMQDWTKNMMELMTNPKRPKSLDDMELIETSGITGDQDSIVYVANEYGIQAAIRELRIGTEMFPDGELHYVVELAIPLQHLDVDLSDPDVRDLEYRIGLRGVKSGGAGGQGYAVIAFGGSTMYSGGSLSRRQQQYERIKYQDQSVPAELSGTYRLAVN